MTNPLSLLPLAIAAGNGRIRAAGGDFIEAQQLVAAGLTLLQRSAPLVRALNGKRSAILLPTSPTFITALAASDGRGAVLINPLAAPAEIAYQCEDANVGAVFTTVALAARVPGDVLVVLLDDAPRSARVIANGVTRDIDLGSHHGFSIEGETDVEGSGEECVIVYTSAMLGRALGAILTHRNLLANVRSTIEALGTTKDDHVLAMLPYSHLFGLTVTANCPLLLGARVTTVERFHPAKVADLLASDITQMVGVPALYHALLSVIERRGIDLHNGSLRLCICGGAALPRDLSNRWADVTGIELREGYGLTEAGPVCLVNRHNRPNVRGTMGHALPSMEVAIMPPALYSPSEIVVPSAQQPLPDGEPGELCVKGTNVFAGYVGGAAGLPLRDGWLHTGDECKRNPDGSITFLGLFKPMFTRNGFNVYPAEVERVIAEMPGVEQVQVRAIPDPQKENAVAILIRGVVTEEQVKRWCELRLSAYKQPGTIDILNAS